MKMNDFFDEVLSKKMDESEKTIADIYPPTDYDYYILGCTAMKNHDLLISHPDELERVLKIDDYDCTIKYKDDTQEFICKCQCYLHTNPDMIALADVYVCPKKKKN